MRKRVTANENSVDVYGDMQKEFHNVIEDLIKPLKEYLKYSVGGKENIEKITKDLVEYIYKVAFNACQDYLEEKDLM